MTSTALADAIRHLDQASSTPELVQATRALCALQDPEAADTLINVLGFNNPAVAAVATQGLIQLGRNIVPTLLVSLLMTLYLFWYVDQSLSISPQTHHQHSQRRSQRLCAAKPFR